MPTAEVEALAAQGWAVVTMDASGWSDRDVLHDAWAAALAFPEHYGRNLDALADCLWEVAEWGPDVAPEAPGLVLVLGGYDTFERGDPDAARTVLEIVEDQARHGARRGHPIRVVRV